MQGVVCFILCFGWSPPAIQAGPVVDSFCKQYQQVVRSKADSQNVKALPPEIQRRMAGNEVVYRCLCQGWKDPICQRPASTGRST